MKRNISGFARECLGLPFGGYFGLPGDSILILSDLKSSDFRPLFSQPVSYLIAESSAEILEITVFYWYTMVRQS